MRYELELDYINLGTITHYPDGVGGTFKHPGDPIDACNFRVAQLIKEELEDGDEPLITPENLKRARIYNANRIPRKLLLEINYRKNKLELYLSKINMQPFPWIRI